MVNVDLDIGDLESVICNYGYSNGEASIIALFIDSRDYTIEVGRWLWDSEFRTYLDGESKEEIVEMITDEGYDFDDCDYYDDGMGSKIVVMYN